MEFFPYSIRPIRAEEDSAEIARLVRVSFGSWLDKSNMDYLRDMEREGQRFREHPLYAKLLPFPYPQRGVVCHDGAGRILGVINFYGFQLNGPCSLLANICVDPTHRQEGIASRMLQESERTLRREGTRAVFLQARTAVPETILFYRKRGYRVTDYREDWIRPRSKAAAAAFPGLRTEQVPESDREHFSERLAEAYPLSVQWNLNFRYELFTPGLIGEIANRLLSPVDRFRRLLDEEGQVLAWAAWQRLSGSTDQMWFIPNGELPDRDYARALRVLSAQYPGKKPLKIDVAAGKEKKLYTDAGLVRLQTLAWMWKEL